MRYKKSSYSELAHAMSLPELILKDAVEGQVGLRRGQWNKIGKLLGLPLRSSYDRESTMASFGGSWFIRPCLFGSPARSVTAAISGIPRTTNTKGVRIQRRCCG